LLCWVQNAPRAFCTQHNKSGERLWRSPAIVMESRQALKRCIERLLLLLLLSRLALLQFCHDCMPSHLLLSPL
jgi:hypothetical protein